MRPNDRHIEILLLGEVQRRRAETQRQRRTIENQVGEIRRLQEQVVELRDLKHQLQALVRTQDPVPVAVAR